ncbi:hypothetical protein LI90_2269 [Carbonactinospora thermoautotrophica]|uniref:Uncharacterized protein n=1 Tax=Carbonactinospora thermoautotrophica TaxID=1469144 RepID=A0A132MTR8_9ACTN|nr:hypothetical protein LI90_2269 [Carbonactinospora thermoautotrophica]
MAGLGALCATVHKVHVGEVCQRFAKTGSGPYFVIGMAPCGVLARAL